MVRDAAGYTFGARLGDRVAGLEPTEECPMVRQMPPGRRQGDACVSGIDTTETHQGGGMHTASWWHVFHFASRQQALTSTLQDVSGSLGA